MTTPTPLPTMAGDTTTAGSPSSSANPLSSLMVELLGVGALALVAGIGPRIGKVVAIFMAGLMVLWLVLHATTLAQLMPGTNVQTQGLLRA
jgi:hypothetical protein